MPKIIRREVIKVTTQLDLFQEAKVEIEKPEPMTEVRLGPVRPGPAAQAAQGSPGQANGYPCRPRGQGYLHRLV